MGYLWNIKKKEHVSTASGCKELASILTGFRLQVSEDRGGRK